jgi:glucosamine--fructose-6-phosphate aminotransferase (isomerizing)
MCGIVGAVAERNITAILVEGLKRLEYRGYDSAGVAVFTNAASSNACVVRARSASWNLPLKHRWSAAWVLPTPVGPPTVRRASATRTRISPVTWPWCTTASSKTTKPCANNSSAGLRVHLGHRHRSDRPPAAPQTQGPRDLTVALKATVKELHGAYGLAVISAASRTAWSPPAAEPAGDRPGPGENFLASELALRQVTDRFMYLEEGDIAEIRRDSVQIWDVNGKPVEREAVQYRDGAEAADKGEFRHFMLKEIHEQPSVVQRTLEGRLATSKCWSGFGPQAAELFAKVRNVQIVACGTSYHAGMVARYWLEELAGIPCQVEVASEFRYRKVVVQPDTLFVTISQSGETADTLAALRNAKELGFLASLAICNVGISSLVRESDLTLLTQAGREIGVASTKAFTTQLVGLLLLTLALGQVRGTLRRRRSHAGGRTAPPADPPGRSAGHGQHRGKSRRAVRRQKPHPVPRPWRAIPGGDGRCAEAQGNFLHPRRSLPGRRAEARPVGAGG